MLLLTLTLLLVLVAAGHAYELLIIGRMKREQEIVYTLLTVWADRWGDPADEVKLALSRILRQGLPYPAYGRRIDDPEGPPVPA